MPAHSQFIELHHASSRDDKDGQPVLVAVDKIETIDMTSYSSTKITMVSGDEHVVKESYFEIHAQICGCDQIKDSEAKP